RFAAGENPTTVSLADVNSDGIPDLVVGNLTSADVSILLGDGHGRFRLEATYPVDFSATAVAAADFDGDGDLDLAVATFSTFLLILLGDGTGHFAATRFAVLGGAFDVVAGDVTGDSRPDLMTGNGSWVSMLAGRATAPSTRP